MGGKAIAIVTFDEVHTKVPNFDKQPKQMGIWTNINVNLFSKSLWNYSKVVT